VQEALAKMTFPELSQILQNQPSFIGAPSPQYGPSYSLLPEHCSIPEEQQDSLGATKKVQPPKLLIDRLFPSFPLPVEEMKHKTQPMKKRLLRSNAHTEPTSTSTTSSAPPTPTPTSTPIKSSDLHKTTPSSLLSMECFQDLLSESCLHELKRWFTRRSSALCSSSPQCPSASPLSSSPPLVSSGKIMKQWQEDSPRKEVQHVADETSSSNQENIKPEGTNRRRGRKKRKVEPEVEIIVDASTQPVVEIEKDIQLEEETPTLTMLPLVAETVVATKGPIKRRKIWKQAMLVSDEEIEEEEQQPPIQTSSATIEMIASLPFNKKQPIPNHTVHDLILMNSSLSSSAQVALRSYFGIA
jgi:hypothetical protein